MSLQERLLEDMKAALKAKDEIRLATLRLVRAAVHNAEIEKRRPLEDSEVLELMAREVRRREEALEFYRQAGRQDLVEQTEREMEVLRSYLPTPLTEEELEALAREVIAQVGATSPRDVGRVMRELMPRVRGRTEGRVVNETVRRLLESAN